MHKTSGLCYLTHLHRHAINLVMTTGAERSLAGEQKIYRFRYFLWLTLPALGYCNILTGKSKYVSG